MPGEASPAVTYGKSWPPFSRILPAKSCTRSTVLSIGDPGAGAHQAEGGRVCAGSAHVLQVSSKPAWHVQVPTGEALSGLSVPSLQGSGRWRMEGHYPSSFPEDMGDKFRFACPLNNSNLHTGQCCSNSTILSLALRKPSFKLLNLMVLKQCEHFLSTTYQKLPFCKLKVHNFCSHRSYFQGVGRNQFFMFSWKHCRVLYICF